MKLLIHRIKMQRKQLTALAIIACLLPVMTPSLALAKRGGRDDNRWEFYGIVQAKPENGYQGEWVIGGRSFISDHGTEIDESDGYLSVGSCAKVQVRDGRVHEIDSEPMYDCR